VAKIEEEFTEGDSFGFDESDHYLYYSCSKGIVITDY
jgi:hypothetical protein